MIMMATISSSCSNAIVADKNWSRNLSGVCDSPLGKPQVRFFSLESLGNARHLNLISARRKASSPVFSLSSSFPSSQVDLEAAEFQPEEAYQANNVHVKFQLQKDCSFGEHFYMVGSDPMFGLWDPEDAVPLTWSHGHIWTAELDMPVGRSISYKFILKGTDGEVLWQPGPDRSFVPWEAENSLTVCEDWENVEFQKIIEGKIGVHEDQEIPTYVKEIEDMPFSSQEGEPNTDIKMLIAGEKVSTLAPKAGNENQGLDMNDKASRLKGSLRSKAKEVAADNTYPPAPKKTNSFVADYISKRVEESAARRDKALSERTTSNTKDRSGDIPKQNLMVAKTALGKNKKAATIAEKKSEDVAGNLIMHEGDPVLVPGLPPSTTVSSGGTIQEEDERKNNIDAAPSNRKARPHTSPELDVKPGLDDDSVQEKRIRMSSQKPNLPADERDSVQWSIGTLQKLLQQFRSSLNKLLEIENERYY